MDREVAARQSSCQLEVDVVAADIINRLEIGGMLTLTSVSWQHLTTTSCCIITSNPIDTFQITSVCIDSITIETHCVS